MEADTESLRSAAPRWSLAGDQQLLGVLQNIHERLVSRCQETNRRLGEMAAALDDASIDLQNVNNKFMALSNSQFIESRVYDDDVDVAPAVAKAEPDKPTESMSEVEQIKLGLKVLEDMHEPLMILDSDSETDSDDDTGRMVLKPKDLYEDRPLPYIIGSYAWQSKWHAGLVAEDSDTDSSAKRERWDRDEYSDSETEITKPVKGHESTLSSQEQESLCSSEISCHMSAAELAANVAARLAKHESDLRPEQELPSDFTPPAPAVRKVYRPDQPAISNIFSDEPPPLEKCYQSEDDNEDNDIFAELRKNQPYAQSNRVQSNVTDELFGSKQGDIFSGFTEHLPTVNTKSTLFSEKQEPELFAEQPPPLPKTDVASAESSVKKPVGGISLFGNKGTESIGAAILKRNQRQSSTEEDVSEDTSQKQEKDIFDHLFAKSEKEQRKAAKKVEKISNKKEPVKEMKVDKKVDIFSDNLFDDIDDIFTSNIPKVPLKTAEKNQKSLFDDDELFTDVAVAKNKSVENTKDNKKSIFDSDDDLFSEKVEKKLQSRDLGEIKNNVEAKKEVSVKSESKMSIFDSDDDLFTDKNDKTSENQSSEIIRRNDNKYNSESETKASVKSDNKRSIFDSDDDLFTDKTEKIPENRSIQNNRDSEIIKSKTNRIFDDIDIFSENVSISKEISVNSIGEESDVVKADIIHKNQSQVHTKTASLFDDDKEDLFITISSHKEVVKKATEKTTGNSKPSIPKGNTEQKNIETVHDNEVPGKNSSSVTKGNEVEENLKKSLFNDDLEDKLFSDKPKQITLRTTDEKSVEISTNTFDDNDLFKGIDLHQTSQSKEQILKNEIKDEIIEEIKDDIKSEIKDELISEFKDDLLVVKNVFDVANAVTSKPVNDSSLGDKNNYFEDAVCKDKLVEGDKNESNKKSSIFDEEENELFSNSSTNIKTKVNEIADRFDINFENPKISEEDTESRGNDINEEPPFLFNEPKQQLFEIQNECSEIFIEPPTFEKPKEPKKSKNVNALFDDDSDDEALFFKKNDPTLDEKPEFDSPTTENRIFGIFQDEPPDLDIDFVQKSNVETKSNSSTDFTDTKKVGVGDTSVNIPKINYSNTSKDQTDSNLTSKPKEIVEKDDVMKSIETQDEFVKSKIMKDEDKTDNAPKPIGRLKSMNFNINVNALLPGASPKKGKTTEQTDTNTQTKSSEDISTKNSPDLESKMVKSISFEGKPDSQVLDNTLSKERPRIQVKRRPSTRRARKEAVRKSGIDFGDDSTDNSSSIDDPPRVTKRGSASIEDKPIVDVPLTRSDDEMILQSSENITTTVIAREPHRDTADIDNELFKSENVETSKKETKEHFSGNECQHIDERALTKDEPILQKPQVTTKTVYILNDEDIFSVEKPKRVLNIVDDDIPGVSTLGKAYKETKNNSDSDDDLFRNVKPTSTSKDSVTKNSGDKLFKSEVETKTAADESDEKLFKSQIKDKIPAKTIFDDTNEDFDENLFKSDSKTKKDNKGIFDSSDDEDLFSKNKSKDVTSEMFKKEVKKVEVKPTLFGDDEDDDDLFGSSRRKKAAESTPSQPVRTKDIVTKSSEPVFEDPLSLFGSDDD